VGGLGALSARALLAVLAAAGVGCGGPPPPPPAGSGGGGEAASGPPAGDEAPDAAGAAGAGPGEGDEAAGPAYVTKGPRPLDPAEVGVGRPVADAPFVDLTGRARRLSELWSDGPLVVVMTSLRCPVTRLYAPELRELLAPYRAEGVRVLVVDPNVQDGDDELAARAEALGWAFPVARDPDYAVADALGARRTSDAFVIDAEGTLRYRGAIDDQYGINYRLPRPRRTLLTDALDAVLAGEEVAEPAMTAPGCLLSRVEVPEGAR